MSHSVGIRLVTHLARHFHANAGKSYRKLGCALARSTTAQYGSVVWDCEEKPFNSGQWLHVGAATVA